MPDLQTALKTALIAAGEKSPSQMSRIWNFIKDSGGSKTSKQVVSTLKIPAGTATSLLAQLVKRQMLSVRYETSHKNAGRKIAHYAAPSGLRTYVLLPTPKKEDAKRKDAPKPDTTQPAVAEVIGSGLMPASLLAPYTVTRPANLDDIEAFVSSLTLPKGKALYLELCKYFGESND